MDAVDSVVEPLREFAKDIVRLVKRCHKPDRKGKDLALARSPRSPIRFVWILMLNGVDLKVCSSWDEDDEEALRWAALEKLPTYDRARTAVLAMPGGLKEVNADKLDAQQRIASVGDDHECFLSMFKDRVDRSTTTAIAQPAKFESIPECFCL
ncbi:Pleiotropic drug resistance protein 4 [Hordeum vulgare]|nr:Pleiotropic drug resistance protein 4 [Hordeum vulgare]